MSKTYHSRRNIRDDWDFEYEYPTGYKGHGVEIKPGEVKSYDASFTTPNDWDKYLRKNSRHPNKKKNTTLTKEFKGTSAAQTRYWTNRAGHREDQSDRCHSIKRTATEKRRQHLKRETKRMIEEASEE